jgi:hypothetical protein
VTAAPPPPTPAPRPTPPPTAPAARFTHVVAEGEGPDQISAWFSSIGQASLYGHNNALHRQLEPGTVIVVSNGKVSLQRP